MRKAGRLRGGGALGTRLLANDTDGGADGATGLRSDTDFFSERI